MNNSSTILQRLWNYCKVLRYQWSLSVATQVEAAVEVGLKRAERLRQPILKRALEGRLVTQ